MIVLQNTSGIKNKNTKKSTNEINHIDDVTTGRNNNHNTSRIFTCIYYLTNARYNCSILLHHLS